MSRSFETIRKSIMAEVSRRNSRPHFTGKDAAARRAFQYAIAMAGAETPHSANIQYGLEKRCEYRRAGDGSTRVFKIDDFEIPHWDFVPEMAEC